MNYSTGSRAFCSIRRTSAVIGLVLAVLTVTASDAEARRTGKVRELAIDMVVIHSTGGPTCDAATGKPIWVKAGTLADDMQKIEADPKLGIHYMIDRDGTLRASVPEDQVANHVFHYSGQSIAIELINDGDGHDPFPEAQLASLVKLLRDIKQRRGITRDGVKRHSDLDHAMLSCDRSQRRKVDPGAAFPYKAILDRVFNPGRKDVSRAVNHQHQPLSSPPV
jgi:N-acetylmuramoyl-L-alanine amidase